MREVERQNGHMLARLRHADRRLSLRPGLTLLTLEALLLLCVMSGRNIPFPASPPNPNEAKCILN